MNRLLIIAVVLLAFQSCAYNAAVDIAPAYDVYSSYEEEIPGSWALFIDSGEFELDEFKFDGFNCSAHTFPLDISSSFSTSAIRTVQNMVLTS